MAAHPIVTRTWATLRIASKTLDPDDVTARLGIAPTDSHKAGERHGKEGQMVYDHGQWELTSQDNVKFEDLESHIAWVLEQLAPAQQELQWITSQPDIKADIFCFWEANSVNAGLKFSPRLLQGIGSLGLALDVDIYFAY